LAAGIYHQHRVLQEAQGVGSNRQPRCYGILQWGFLRWISSTEHLYHMPQFGLSAILQDFLSTVILLSQPFGGDLVVHRRLRLSH